MNRRIIILAPMCGITDRPFRKIVRKFGTQLVSSEMTVDRACIRNICREDDYRNESPISVQLAGNDPKIMSEAARIVESKGADYIDINMGCPAKKIAINSYAGAALLKDHDLAVRIVREVKNAVNIPVTVKMRTGWEDKSSESLANRLKLEGVKRITIHGRTRNQMYTGKADWDYIYHVYDNANIEVIGNGDIKSIYDASEKIKTLPGIMIGRGIQGAPWFINQVDRYINDNIIIQDPTRKEKVEIILEHISEMEDFYKERAIMFIKKHISWYIKCSATRASINISRSTKEIIEIVKNESILS